MIYTQTIDCLDLKQIADSGQCFRMNPAGDGGYTIVSCGHFLKIDQQDREITFDCPEEELTYWLHYFDCETDYNLILNSINPNDAYLTEAAAAGRGIRILRQDPWEMIITFVISQQKTIPKIKELTEALCRGWGTPLDNGARAFPTPVQLSAASLEELLELKLGYRAKYIHRLCADACQGLLDLQSLQRMTYEESMEYLTGFYGIGKKVANCVCLFGLHHIEAFPVDTWIEKILMREYFRPRKYHRTPKNCLYDAILADNFGQYGGYAGVLQQYIFYYERLKQNKL